ncbi:MAG: Cof-type HAD-IIB family hydrolase [Erysipelotrichia bacterium]|nr:Cof-type HAD-IIB family hydrolase [Erysipelotrichia bacterium]
MKKYLFFDIDGTLVSHLERSVPKSAQAAIQQARAAGNMCFLCTGRAHFMQDGIQSLEMDGIICSNGASAEINGVRVLNRPIPNDMVRALQEISEQCRVGYCLQGYEKGWRNQLNKEIFAKMSRTMPKSMQNHFMTSRYFALGHNSISAYRGEEIYKIDVSFTKDSDKELFEQKLNPQLNYIRMLSMNRNMRDGAEITLKGVTKGKSALAIAALYGGTAKDCYGFGDSLNDLDLLKQCGTGIAMGNAVEELKKQADYITSDILDDGIAGAMNYFHLTR